MSWSLEFAVTGRDCLLLMPVTPPNLKSIVKPNNCPQLMLMILPDLDYAVGIGGYMVQVWRTLRSLDCVHVISVWLLLTWMNLGRLDFVVGMNDCMLLMRRKSQSVDCVCG